MKKYNSSKKSGTPFKPLLKPLFLFVMGIFLGSILTVYGALKNVNLAEYLGDNDGLDLVEFYGDLLGFSGHHFREQKLYRGYIEDLQIGVNPQTLEISAIPNSPCGEAIEPGDELRIDDLNREIEDDRIRTDAQFTTFRNQVQAMKTEGFGVIQVVGAGGKPAAIEIDLLRSEKICYRKPESVQVLEEMLAEKKWKEADVKTYQIMLEFGDKSRKGYLNSGAIRNFPCAYLRILDRLWRDASGDRFGFKIQKEIYLETGNELGQENLRKYDLDSYVHFIDLVRWIETGREDGRESWKPYEDLTFSLEAPEGHLPRLHLLERGLKAEESGYQLNSPNSLPLTTQEIQARNLFFSRVEACEL